MPSGTTMTVLHDSQRQKGEQRKDVVIADFGEYRAAAFI